MSPRPHLEVPKRKLVVSMFATIDGVVEAPDKWSASTWTDEAETFKREELFANDAVLLRRLSYKEFAGAWPFMTDEPGFADRMNGLPKYVVSRTTDQATWNAAVIKADLADRVSTRRHRTTDV